MSAGCGWVLTVWVPFGLCRPRVLPLARLHRFVVWGGLHQPLLLSRRLLLVWRGGLLILRHERRVGT